MPDDFDFSNGFDFTNPVHTALLHDTHEQIDTSAQRKSKRLANLLVALHSWF